MGITRGQKAGAGIAGGLGGAATGAALGSIVPGLGTGIGAILGGLLGVGGGVGQAGPTDQHLMKQQAKAQAATAAKKPSGKNVSFNNPSAGFTPSANQDSFWGGRPAGLETYNQYTPEQQQAFSQVLQQALGGLKNNQFDFAPIEQQAREGFAQKTIPGIAERFSQLGAQRSSAFPQLLGQAGAGLETDLAAMKQNYGLQQQSALHNLLGIGLQPQFESLYNQGNQGFGKGLAENLLSSLLSGENIASGLGSIRDMIAKRGNKNNQEMGLAPIDQYYNAPTAKMPSTPGGTLKSIYKPSNIVPGAQMPGGIVSGIGKVPSMPSMPKTNVGALKGLYGI